MNSVVIVNTEEGIVDNINGRKIELNRRATTELEISDWIAFKAKHSKQVEGGFYYAEDPEIEAAALEGYNYKIGEKFERDGFAVIKAEFDRGDFSTDHETKLANEWLNSHTEDREIAKEEREEKALNISEKALLNSRLANFIALLAVVIAVVSWYK